MAHNIITSNDINVNANAVMQTTTRPILVQYKYSPTDATPVPILVQIDVLVEENGAFSKVGSTQVSSKDFDSTSTNTVFTFDISSILQSKISSGFYTSIFSSNSGSPIDLKNSASNQDYKSLVRYKTEASLPDKSVFRDEYDRRILKYLCGKGMDSISWYKPEDFGEDAIYNTNHPMCSTLERFTVNKEGFSHCEAINDSVECSNEGDCNWSEIVPGKGTCRPKPS